VDHVVADHVAEAAFLQLDAVALRDAGAVRVMNVIALDETVGEPAGVAVAAQVHAFAGAVGVMDVIAQDPEAFVRAAGVRGDRDVAGVVDFAALDRDEARAHQADAVRAAGELDVAHHEVAGPGDLEHVLAGVGLPDQRALAIPRAHHDRLLRRSIDRDPKAAVDGVRAAGKPQLFAGLERGDRRPEIPARRDVDRECGGRGGDEHGRDGDRKNPAMKVRHERVLRMRKGQVRTISDLAPVGECLSSVTVLAKMAQPPAIIGGTSSVSREPR
jgi:hypothetical protein